MINIKQQASHIGKIMQNLAFQKPTSTSCPISFRFTLIIWIFRSLYALGHNSYSHYFHLLCVSVGRLLPLVGAKNRRQEYPCPKFGGRAAGAMQASCARLCLARYCTRKGNTWIQFLWCIGGMCLVSTSHCMTLHDILEHIGAQTCVRGHWWFEIPIASTAARMICWWGKCPRF